MAPETREPAVAGRFYPADPTRMEQELLEYLARPPGDVGASQDAIAVVAPHAGWMYSGRIAGQTYAEVRVPDRVVVLCPNHTGLGVRRSLWASGSWRIPGGDVAVESTLAERLQFAPRSKLKSDRLAHLREHAIEVHLPFLRAKNRAVRVVPICLGGLSLPECVELGEALGNVLANESERVLIVASTDMSHYISAEAAEKLDALALDRVKALDAEGLFRVVTERDISMCGYVPTTVALIAARVLGAKSGALVRYGNSGETSGDYDRVVGYAGVIID
jgi:AmmeMemoRadiSam system protein B